MKLFHVLRGDDMVGNRLGIVLRIYDGVRDWELLFIAPVPGRWPTITAFNRAVIQNAKLHACILFGRAPPRIGWHVRTCFEMRYEPHTDTGQRVNLWRVTP